MTKLERESILKKWDLSEEELTDIINENPSMRGLMLGYIAEYKLQQMFFNDSRTEKALKDDDHDRKKKGDLRITYKGQEFLVECKSLQTNSIRMTDEGYSGKYQCDASDRRAVTFSDGSSIQTTCLLVGEFDIVAVNLFSFEEKWKFAFALNRDLPRSRYKKYTEFQRKELLSTLIPITFPISNPYHEDPFVLFDLLINETSQK